MTTEIGDFKRKEAAATDEVAQPNPGDDLLVPPGAGAAAIASFVASGKAKEAKPVKEPAAPLPKTQPDKVQPKAPPKRNASVLSSMLTENDVTPQAEQQQPPRNAEQEDKRLANLIQRAEDAPELTYEERLEAHSLTMEQAMTIVSGVFDNGYYEKVYPVVGTATVTLRTRKTEDQDRLLQRIEADNPQFPASVSQLVSKYNLAASMVDYRGVNLENEDFKTRYKRVCEFPENIFRVLCTKLARFDDMVMDVMDEGAIANF